MSDAPHYLPDNYLVPIDDAVARAAAVREARAAVLSPLQAIFVNHLFEANMDLATAAQRSGIATKKARDWVEQEGPVADLIGSRLNEMARTSKVTVEAIVEKLWDEGTRMPVHDEDKTVSHAARVSALSHLAKYKGMFDKGGGKNNPKISVNINIDGDSPVTIEGENDDGTT